MTTNKEFRSGQIDSPLAGAIETLADRKVVLLDDARWNAFLAALDAPQKPWPRLERLLNEPSVFECVPAPAIGARLSKSSAPIELSMISIVAKKTWTGS